MTAGTSAINIDGRPSTSV